MSPSQHPPPPPESSKPAAAAADDNAADLAQAYKDLVRYRRFPLRSPGFLHTQFISPFFPLASAPSIIPPEALVECSLSR
jgi:hypothetical protein